MGNEKVDAEAIERRLRRVEGFLLVLLASDSDWPDDEQFFHEVLMRLARAPEPPFFEELLHRVFRRKPGGRISRLEEKVSRLATTIEDNQLSLHQYLSLALLGADTDDIPLRRIVPVRIYLKKDDPAVRDALSEAVTSFAASLGLDVSDDLPAEKGSWFKRWWTKSKEVLRQPEMQARLEKGERALELQALQKPQAAVDKDQAEGAAALISSLDKTDDAICQVGSILLVKNKAKVVVRTLTQKELIHIEKHPELLASPDEILAALGACSHDAPQIVPSLPSKAI